MEPLKRRVLLRIDVGETDELLVFEAELGPGAASERHAHPGHDVIYVLEGDALVDIEGRAPVAVRPGDVVHVPPGQPHQARNVSGSLHRVLAVWVGPKGTLAPR